MSAMTQRPALRWSVPLAVLVLVLALVAVVGRARPASAEVDLPDRTAAQLLADLQSADTTALSGTVSWTVDLGLPALPTAGGDGGPFGAGADLTSLISGTHTLRVWAAAPDRLRVDLPSTMGEYDLVLRGTDLWTWSSERNAATHVTVPTAPDGSSAPDLPALPDLPTSADPAALTPAGVAEQVLAALDPTTAVTTLPARSVAGRDAYTLVLTPKDDATLVGSVQIAIDAAERVPTRVQVFPAADPSTAAVDVGFTDVTFRAPSDDVFAFTPPSGATVDEVGPGDLAGPAAGSDGSTPGPRSTPGTPPDGGAPLPPTIVGSGWSAVLVAEHAAAEPGGEEGRSDGRLDDPATDLTGMLAALPQVSGSWGSGRLFAGTLFSALLTDDGRVLVGAVPGERLEAVAAGAR